MENHHFSWKNSLFLWPFSTAMLVYQRKTISVDKCDAFPSVQCLDNYPDFIGQLRAGCRIDVSHYSDRLKSNKEAICIQQTIKRNFKKIISLQTLTVGNCIWLVVSTTLKNICQWEGWHPIYETENKSHVRNHQPDYSSFSYPMWQKWSAKITITIPSPSLFYTR